MEKEPVEALARDLPVPEFQPARGHERKADEPPDDAGGDEVVLKQLDPGAQPRADEQHERKQAEKNEVFKIASHTSDSGLLG